MDALRLLISAVTEDLSIGRCKLLCSGYNGGGCEVEHNTRSVPAPPVTVYLWWYLKEQSGRKLTKKEAKQTVRDICPSATIAADLWVS